MWGSLDAVASEVRNIYQPAWSTPNKKQSDANKGNNNRGGRKINWRLKIAHIPDLVFLFPPRQSYATQRLRSAARKKRPKRYSNLTLMLLLAGDTLSTAVAEMNMP